MENNIEPRLLQIVGGTNSFKIDDSGEEVSLLAFDGGIPRNAEDGDTAQISLMQGNTNVGRYDCQLFTGTNTIKFSTSELSKLPVGSYQMELLYHHAETTAIYPSFGFLPIEINENTMLLSQGLSSITLDQLKGELEEKLEDIASTKLKGDPGDPGKNGNDGLAATVNVGTVTSDPTIKEITVANSGTANNAVLNFSFPSIAKNLGVNVKNYGAIGDGKTDNHDAILAAIKDAKDTGINHVHFPAGKYLTSNVNIEVENLAITGDDRMSTTIISNQSDPLFSMKCDSMIRDLGFHSELLEDNTMISISKRGNDVAYWNITLQNLRFDSMEYPDQTKKVVGNWTMRPFWFDINNLGLWDVTIRDCSMQYVYAGLTVDTTNNGWMTGSLFDNLVVKGFTHHAYGLISSTNTERQISQCAFTNLDAQVLYETTGDDAAGYIVSGTGNNFDNLRLFNDGTYTNHAIELRYYGGSNYDPQMPTFGYGSTAMNSFKGGTLEGTIYDPDNIRDLQHFDHVQLQVTGDNGSLQMVNVNDPIYENLLSKRGFLRNIVGDIQRDFPADSKITTGADQYGQYIDIEMTNTDGSFDYALSEPESTVNALRNSDYSIGIRFKNMGAPNKVTLSAYLQFDGKDHSSNSLYWFVNPSIQDELMEYSWVYKADPAFFNGINKFNEGDNSCKFYIPKGTHIRIYSVFLCAGRVLDFERVTNNSIINEGYGSVTPPFSGISLNSITKQMIRYAGRYLITNNNQPADMPSDLQDGDTVIEIISGSNSNEGIIKLFNLKNNNLWMCGVYNGNANTWIKMHA